jgi:transcriptional regulator with XRE-family HTH domain
MIDVLRHFIQNPLGHVPGGVHVLPDIPVKDHPNRYRRNAQPVGKIPEGQTMQQQPAPHPSRGCVLEGVLVFVAHDKKPFVTFLSTTITGLGTLSTKKTVLGDFVSRLGELVEILADNKYTVFAKKAGIPPSTFQNYVNGRFPKAEHLLRIRDVFRVNLDWLLSGEGEMLLGRGDIVKEVPPKSAYSVEYRAEGQGGPERPMALGRAVEVLTRIIQAGPLPLKMAISSELYYIDRLLDEHEQLQATANGVQTEALRQHEERIQALEERLRRERQKAEHAVEKLKQSGGT